MKDEARVIGVDDAAFTWEDATVPVVGVVTRGGRYVDGVFRTDVAVDGDDATDRLAAALHASGYLDGARAVMVDGVTLGGFNVVDVTRLNRETRTPVITVTRGAPDMTAVERALRKHHPGQADARLARMRATPQVRVDTEGQGLTLGHAGCTTDFAVETVTRCTLRGLIPEPLRLAHVIARGVFR